MYSWQSALELVANYYKINQDLLRTVSIPLPVLEELKPYFSGNGLQIGGFVGLTHLYIANHLKSIGGTICTIDPNLMHEDVSNCFNIMSFLTMKYKLHTNSLLVCGYSDPQIKILHQMGARYDFVLVDGYHDRTNVERDVELADQILKNGGHLILDDIDFWKEPRDYYNNFSLDGYEKIPCNPRVGLLKKL